MAPTLKMNGTNLAECCNSVGYNDEPGDWTETQPQSLTLTD